MVETKIIMLEDKVYVEKTLYCNYCKAEVLKYKKIIFDKKENLTIEWLENVKCPNCSQINKSLNLYE